MQWLFCKVNCWLYVILISTKTVFVWSCHINLTNYCTGNLANLFGRLKFTKLYKEWPFFFHCCSLWSLLLAKFLLIALEAMLWQKIPFLNMVSLYYQSMFNSWLHILSFVLPLTSVSMKVRGPSHVSFLPSMYHLTYPQKAHKA